MHPRFVREFAFRILAFSCRGNQGWKLALIPKNLTITVIATFAALAGGYYAIHVVNRMNVERSQQSQTVLDGDKPPGGLVAPSVSVYNPVSGTKPVSGQPKLIAVILSDAVALVVSTVSDREELDYANSLIAQGRIAVASGDSERVYGVVQLLRDLAEQAAIECVVYPVLDASGHPEVADGPVDGFVTLKSVCLADGPGRAQRYLDTKLVHVVNYGDPVVVPAPVGEVAVQAVGSTGSYGIKQKGTTKIRWLVQGIGSPQ
jgi:hypothetical protein